jgi:hypothetical protein
MSPLRVYELFKKITDEDAVILWLNPKYVRHTIRLLRCVFLCFGHMRPPPCHARSLARTWYLSPPPYNHTVTNPTPNLHTVLPIVTSSSSSSSLPPPPLLVIIRHGRPENLILHNLLVPPVPIRPSVAMEVSNDRFSFVLME